MTEYTDPTKVEPGRAGTATVRGVKGVRLWRSGLTLAHVWMSASELPTDRWDSGLWHKHSDITDLLLDPLPGEASVGSVVITREELKARNFGIDLDEDRGYANDLRAKGSATAADLIDLVVDKVAALPKPVPPKPKGQVVAFVDERFWHPTDDGGWLPVEGSDDDAPTWADLVEIARKEDRRDPVVYRAEGVS